MEVAPISRSHSPRSLENQAARLLPTEARSGIASFAAFGVVRVPAVPACHEDVNRKRIVFLPQFLDGCIYVPYSLVECRKGNLQAIGRIWFI
jgi:hypothetical protein